MSTAVDLAEKSSPAVRSAQANVRKAQAALSETKDVYYPSMDIGSSVGPPPYGFPLGNPDIYNIDMQSLVLSFAQPDYIRAARAGLRAAALNLRDQQQQIALDVSLDYIELDHDLAEVAALNEEKSYAGNLISIELDRVGAGVDPRVNLLQAQLTGAQVDEKQIQLENDADEMRLKLAHLTGLPLDGLQTDTASIPAPPAFGEQESSDQQLADNNSGVASAYENARSRYLIAHGDKRQVNRPSIGFGLKYQRFARFQNFASYYHNFQQNNVSAGIQLTFPLYDRTLKAKSRESAADAVIAQAQADESRNKLSEEVLTARRTVREIAAEQRVAEIQSELAQEQLKAVDAELTNGPGAPGAQPVAPSAAQKARIEERERYEDLLDANFSLMKVELNLLRMTGQIEDWVHASLK
ncbi:MAG TPA: TolC family protein [Acidobacteriaceae bacterium]|nr:TolC family protein [Acidobacteriaceae bacterium]